MGCDVNAEATLYLTKNSDFLEIVSERSKKQAECETSIPLQNLLSRFQDNHLNGNCIKLDRISLLDLSYCQLMDIPYSCQMPNLKHLNLSHNKLTNIPSCIYSDLENLEYLDLGHNKIETFDLQPSCLLNIKVVKLNNNLLKSLPKWVLNFQCTNLEKLNFSSNKATNYNFPKNSYNKDLTKLKKLKLRNAHLIDTDFNFIKCYQCLEYLDISNKGTDTLNIFHDPDNLFVKLKWKELKILKMNNLSISIFPEGIAWIETLTELRINQNCISWLPDGIEFLVNLRTLDISQNLLIAIPEKICKLELLESLLANRNVIEVCPDFTTLPSLKTLDLYDNMLDNVSFNCDILEKLDLEYNYFETGSILHYQAKLNALRNGFKTDRDRTNGRKNRETRDDSGDERATSDEEDKSDYDKTVTRGFIDETEDWDAPATVKEKNPEIDSEDEDWEGEEKLAVNKLRRVRRKVYVEDEDWMFEDAEENT